MAAALVRAEAGMVVLELEVRVVVAEVWRLCVTDFLQSTAVPKTSKKRAFTFWSEGFWEDILSCRKDQYSWMMYAEFVGLSLLYYFGNIY